MNHRTALGALHIGALFFGLTGVFGKLAASASKALLTRINNTVRLASCSHPHSFNTAARRLTQDWTGY
mgnify:CR=1 FL=1